VFRFTLHALLSLPLALCYSLYLPFSLISLIDVISPFSKDILKKQFPAFFALFAGQPMQGGQRHI
jgi:hypothetical protein